MDRWRSTIVAALLPSHPVPATFWPSFAARAPWVLRWGVTAAVVAIWWGAPLWSGRLRTFGGLEREEQQRVLTTLATHRSHVLRQLIVPLKLATAFGAFGGGA